MRKVKRHLFVPPDLRANAYEDRPLPIGHQQTISQPYIVAKMTELAQIKAGDKVLEIGTGSGYQAAVLAALGALVFSIEIVEPLSLLAKENLATAGYRNIALRVGDGYKGWPEEQPFAAVIVTAAPPAIPEPLKQQLKVGGRLVIPVGEEARQRLIVIERRGPKEFSERVVFPVAFVPMTGEANQK